MENYIKILEEIRETRNGQLKIVEAFFDEFIGLGEMYLNIIEIRSKHYIANTESMELCELDDFIQNEIIENIYEYDDFIKNFIENYYERKN